MESERNEVRVSAAGVVTVMERPCLEKRLREVAGSS